MVWSKFDFDQVFWGSRSAMPCVETGCSAVVVRGEHGKRGYNQHILESEVDHVRSQRLSHIRRPRRKRCQKYSLCHPSRRRCADFLFGFHRRFHGLIFAAHGRAVEPDKARPQPATVVALRVFFCRPVAGVMRSASVPEATPALKAHCGACRTGMMCSAPGAISNSSQAPETACKRAIKRVLRFKVSV